MDDSRASYLILNPAVGIATESRRAQSQWKRGRLFGCFILTPRVTIFQDLLKVSLLICRLCGLGASVANYAFRFIQPLKVSSSPSSGVLALDSNSNWGPLPEFGNPDKFFHNPLQIERPYRWEPSTNPRVGQSKDSPEAHASRP